MLSMVVAVGKNNAIGKDNKLLWHLPNDLKHFKNITEGHAIIMGRKTFQSLPKMLPNRIHFVITRDMDFWLAEETAVSFHSIEDMMKFVNETKEDFYVIGGGQIYKEFLPYTDRIYLTEVDIKVEADTYFPELDKSEWDVID